MNKSLIPFEAHCEEIEDCISFNETSINAKNSLNSYIDWKTLNQDPSSKTLLTDFFKFSSYNSRTLYNSLYLSLIASFEDFLRNTLSEFLQTLSENVTEFNSLKPEFIKKHIHLTGRLLSNIYSPLDYLNLNYYSLSKNIGSCFPDSGNFSLNHEISTQISSLIELENIFEFLKSSDIIIDPDIIGSEKEIQSIVKETSKRKAGNSALEKLKEMSKTRNRLAHTGQTSSTISKEVIREDIKFLKSIAKIICTTLEAEIQSKYPKP